MLRSLNYDLSNPRTYAATTWADSQAPIFRLDVVSSNNQTARVRLKPVTLGLNNLPGEKK
jgi:hypothetical protein